METAIEICPERGEEAYSLEAELVAACYPSAQVIEHEMSLGADGKSFYDCVSLLYHGEILRWWFRY